MTPYNELFGALAKAQGEMQAAGLNSANPFFKSKYADFAEIVRASRPALTKNGLCVVQRLVMEGDQQVLVGTLGHSSGQFIESFMKVNPVKNDPQSLGSFLSYARRYQYAALVGVTISDDSDDDGEVATKPYRHEPVSKFITDEQHEMIQNELKDHPEIAKMILSTLKVNSLKEMPKDVFLSTIKRIREIK